MTKQQEKIAEGLIKRMKEDENGTTSYIKYASLFHIPEEEMRIVVRALRDDLELIKDYKPKSFSIRLTEKGWDFTSFEEERKKRESEENKKWYDTENAKRAFEDYPKIKRRARNSYIISIVSVILTAIGLMIKWK